ncbi:hypothetical protein ALC60_10995 [Trachymyrmex zeteki]|uniref:Uncharacterized protein n=1 Tax=Mycetomoellerius zeteki TaxID=64791 RepID=A0A151WPZ2_9HYME|nr:hypothetical protein ALC60_10995 [Trachymyrmex zeteki]
MPHKHAPTRAHPAVREHARNSPPRCAASTELAKRAPTERGNEGEHRQTGGGGRDGKRRRSWGLLLPRIRQRPKGEIGR